jgi:hypothetical protein
MCACAAYQSTPIPSPLPAAVSGLAQPCPANTVTPDVASPVLLALLPSERIAAVGSMLLTSVDNCTTLPGHGWNDQDGFAAACPPGSWSPGYDHHPCRPCGAGLTTNSTSATALDLCVAVPGWERTGPGRAQPCTAGTYSTGALQTCTACPAGSTSPPAASSAADCSICAPGWGAAPAVRSPASSAQEGPALCAPCAPGSFSAGGTSLPCTPCAPGYTSRDYSSSSSDCYEAFVVTYDWLPTPADALVSAMIEPAAGNSSAAANPATSPAACGAACAADSACQVGRSQTAKGGGWHLAQCCHCKRC